MPCDLIYRAPIAGEKFVFPHLHPVKMPLAIGGSLFLLATAITFLTIGILAHRIVHHQPSLQALQTFQNRVAIAFLTTGALAGVGAIISFSSAKVQSRNFFADRTKIIFALGASVAFLALAILFLPLGIALHRTHHSSLEALCKLQRVSSIALMASGAFCALAGTSLSFHIRLQFVEKERLMQIVRASEEN